MNFTQKLPAYVIGGGMFLGVIVAIGLWYLALFALAVLVFIIFWLIARRQQNDRREVLVFRPGMMIPAEVWAKTEGLPLTPSTEPVNISLVELEKYKDNWETVRATAQVERSGEVSVSAFLIAYRTPSADYGIVLAYDRLVLAQVREIEKDALFEPLWSMGGIFHVAATFTFDSSLSPSSARFRLPMQLEPSDGVLSTAEQTAWNALWRGVRGKSPK
jgi:hypothetical protein